MIDRLVSKEDFYNPVFIEFWKGLIRDSSGRWTDYYSKGIKYFCYGKQSKPDLNNRTQLAFIKASIKQEKTFLYGLQNKDFENIKEWLIKLHRKQVYTKNGQILSERRISMGEHTLIVAGSILNLAQKYNDSYTNSGTQIVYLLGIDSQGFPMDKWVNMRKVIHYYPHPKYFTQYLQMMKNKLEEFIHGVSGVVSKEILLIIASYYQYGINMHMFENTNQSLFANQVNAMLGQIDLKPIEHGILDFAAIRLQPGNFARYFIDEVKRVNKSPRFA